MNLNEYVDHIVELAMEVDVVDPIDWGMLAINERDAYRLMALKLVEDLLPKYEDPELFRDIMMATIVQLVVENFTLNLKLQQDKRKKQPW